MALFGFGKDKRDGGLNQLVLAYLEDAQRIRCPILLVDTKKKEVPALIQAVEEDEDIFSLQLNGTASLEKGAKVGIVFVMENVRMGANTRVAGTRAGLAELEIPDELELLERRKLPRARLNPREGATVTALTGLFEGIGITGTIENVSEGGARIRVDKAINIKGEKKLPLGSSLVPVGQAFMLVKLNKLPKCPAVMELTGQVAYVDDGSGLCLGITFEKPRQDFAAAIRGLVSSRSAAIPTTIPPKTRRSTEPQEESLLPSRNEAPPKAEPPPKPIKEEPEKTDKAAVKPSPVLSGTTPAPSATPSKEAEASVASPSPAAVPSRNEALLKIKKRARTLVVLSDSGHGNLLQAHMVDEGYGRVLLVQTWEELANNIPQPNVGLLFIDCRMPILESFERLQHLQEEGAHLPPVVLAAEEISRALVLAAHRSGVSQLLLKPYVLDDSFSSLLEQQMGLV